MIGEKIRELRLMKKMTQAELAGDTVTRNMLSQIENGIAQPSITTMTELAQRLDAPLAYFFAEVGSLDTFRKLETIDKIKKHYAAGEYAKCLTKLRELGVADDETEFLYAQSSLKYGIIRYRAGYLESAQANMKEAIAHAHNSLYAGPELWKPAEQFLDVIRYIRDAEADLPPVCTSGGESTDMLADLAYIRALAGDKSQFDYAMIYPLYAEHLEVRAAVAEGLACDVAAERLRAILASCDGRRYAVLKYYVLCDLEDCSRRAEDFKGAYECSSERLALAANMNK